MRTHVNRLLIFALILICSCSGDDHHELDRKQNNLLYFNFTLKGSSYHVSNADYNFEDDGYTKICNKDWVRGWIDYILEDPTEENFIESVDFYFTKKVFKDELDPSDDLSYLHKVLGSDKVGFPILGNGYYEVFDLENSVFTVNRTVSAEAFLSIKTKDYFYRSSSVVPNERSDESFITIDRVIMNEGEDKILYPFIVEGEFKVNLFEGMYGTTSEIVEGKFRWPVYYVTGSELTAVCR